MQHQTSTHAGNILSSYGNPCKLDPVQVYATCMCLPKRKGKWALPKKILPRHWTTIWQRGTLWKTLFQNKPSGTINPVYLPRKLLNNTKNVPIKKHCLSQLLPNIFILQLGRNIPLTTMTSIELRLLLLYHSKGEMLRREQAKGHRKGTRAWQNDIQSL